MKEVGNSRPDKSRKNKWVVTESGIGEIKRKIESEDNFVAAYSTPIEDRGMREQISCDETHWWRPICGKRK